MTRTFTFLVAAVTLAGCAQLIAPLPHSAPQSTIPSSTKPSAAVIRYAQSECLDACVGLYFNFPDDVMLYDDGRLIVTESGKDGWQMKERQLSRDQMCALVNRIRATGFFEFDAQPYLDAFKRYEPRGYVVDNTLEVNADKSRSLAFDANWFADVNDFAKADLTPYAWITATRIVTELATQGDFQPYRPDKALLWVQDDRTTAQFQPDGFSEERVNSGIPGFDLPAAILRRFGDKPAIGTMLISGTEASAVFAAFGHTSLVNKVYQLGDRVYYLSVRALLPDEIAEEWDKEQPKQNGWGPTLKRETPTLDCSLGGQ